MLLDLGWDEELQSTQDGLYAFRNDHLELVKTSCSSW